MTWIWGTGFSLPILAQFVLRSTPTLLREASYVHVDLPTAVLTGNRKLEQGTAELTILVLGTEFHAAVLGTSFDRDAVSTAAIRCEDETGYEILRAGRAVRD